jgi:hypothetical protein
MKSFADELLMESNSHKEEAFYSLYLSSFYNYAKGLEFALECIGNKVKVPWREPAAGDNPLSPDIKTELSDMLIHLESLAVPSVIEKGGVTTPAYQCSVSDVRSWVSTLRRVV